MSRHEFPTDEELAIADRESLRSALMRAAACLTESGSMLHPRNLGGHSEEDALEHMNKSVRDIVRIADAIAAQAIRSTGILPDSIEAKLKSAS